MMVGVDLDGLVTGVSIVKMTETPGFGTRATSESWFLSQFAGQSAAVELGNGVDALSGATVTSRAIAGGVRIAVNQVLGYLDREGGGAP